MTFCYEKHNYYYFDLYLRAIIIKPNPDKPERIATKAPRHKNKCLTTVQSSEVLGSKVTPVGNCLL
jgi:hypothetical protein